MSNYADILRAISPRPTMADIATLIEGIWASTFPLSGTTWSPTWGATGSMTFTSVTTETAKYFRCGKLIFFYIIAYGTLGGSDGNAITFTLPAAHDTSATYAYRFIGSGNAWRLAEWESNVTVATGDSALSSPTTTAKIKRHDLADFTASGTHTTYIKLCGFYEAA